MINRFFTIVLIVAVTVVTAAASQTAVASTITAIGRGHATCTESVNLDKTGTSGGAENEHGSQMPSSKALTSQASFQAERTGLSEMGFSDPPARRP